jgi:hypothetical protein
MNMLKITNMRSIATALLRIASALLRALNVPYQA